MRYSADISPYKSDDSCRAFPFSTDEWSPETVDTLRKRLAAQRTPREKAAGLVIGAGGLPYICDQLAVSQIIVADLHEPTINTTLRRTQQVAYYSDWAAYDAGIAAKLNDRESTSYLQEVRRAQESGLRGDYSQTKAGLATIAFRGVAGDILANAPRIGDELRASDQLVSFINVTNVADYLPHHDADPAGRRILWKAMATLPLSSDVIIVDSSVNDVTAEVYYPASYCETFDMGPKMVSLDDIMGQL